LAEARRRTAVLISGRGSNLAALIAAAQAADYPAAIALVVADRPEAGGLAHARAAGVAAQVIAHAGRGTDAGFDQRLAETLDRERIELVCLAGFMRLLTAELVEAWRDRMLNIHPSLLPLFPGLDTHARALAAGVKLHGATVHFVRPAVDRGPIVAQGAVAVLPDDTPGSLGGRVLTEVEHRLYPLAVGLVASGRVSVVGERALVDRAEGGGAALLSPAA
jgi:phosphoribosylglycinamide formyltransferase-1